LHIANAFNEYFTTVALTIVEDLNKDNNKNMTDINPLYYLNNMSNFNFETIKWHYISTNKISKIIKSLKTKSSYGYDEISSRMLKASMPFIISPLAYISNQSLA
jgi:guanylate kinase